MEDWRRMAAAAATGHDVVCRTQAFQAIEVAHRLFSLAAEVCGSFRHDLPYQRCPADELPHLHTAMNHVFDAMLSTRRVSTSQAGSGHVFSLCTARMGLQDSAPASWQAWKGHHADAAARAAMALESLDSALSHGAAAVGAVGVMLGTAPVQVGGGEHAANALLDLELYNFGLGPTPPQGFPLWSAWGHAAEQLLDRVTDDLAMARAALEQMRHADAAANSQAWVLLSR